MPENHWPLVHEYRRAVSDELVLPIRCPDDRTELAPVVGRDGDPALKCFSCQSVFHIGTHVYDQMKEALSGTK